MSSRPMIQYVYITDYELKELLSSKGFQFIEKGYNESTNERFWKYEQCADISSVIVPWETNKRNMKLSLERWQMNKGE